MILLSAARDIRQRQSRGRIGGNEGLPQHLLQLGQEHFGIDRLRQKIGRAEEQAFVHRQGVVS